MDRRKFLQLGGAVSVLGLGACSRTKGATPATTTVGPSSTVAGTAPATSLPVVQPPGATADRRLVLVQLNGGNDLLNTLPPADGRYRDLRPTLAVPEAELVALPGLPESSLHPSLAPLLPLWDAGELALIQGIGFSDPNRSHFVAMDRWWRADDLAAPGWLGRVLDALGGELPPLYATALGGGAPVLNGERMQPAVITTPATFGFRGLDPSWLAFGDSTAGGGGFDSAARRAMTRAVDTVAAFEGLVDGASGDEITDREGGATIAGGMDVAARLLTGDVGARLVVVSASGFDTHAGQATAHAGLLADLATGLASFSVAMEGAGLADDVLVVVTSEFGRRAAENGSGGTDHGAGGLAMALGAGVEGGGYGAVDLGDLLDGDVRPVVAPAALFTRCLDWLGADADAVLGGRDDSLVLLR